MVKRIGYSGGKITVHKTASSRTAVLQRLRSFLDQNEPELVRFLVNMWRTQGRAITYKELREALLSGEISPYLLEEWQQDYSLFVVQYYRPKLEAAMAAAAAELEKRYPDWRYDPMAAATQEWATNHGAEFVTNSTATQIEGLRTVVQQAATLENIGVDELSRVIRPMVGLTVQQSRANLRYYQNLLDHGTSTQRARDLSIRYAARQHRYRGYNIARTELAFAYNQGSYEATKQAQAAGYMGDTVKIWCTADDERVCHICGGLEGKRAAMDEDFSFRTRLQGRNETIRRVPPAHPSCRCAVMYKEISPPIIR